MKWRMVTSPSWLTPQSALRPSKMKLRFVLGR